MENFKKLSREELKNTFGGRACTLTMQNANGSWTTYSGSCDTQLQTTVVANSDGSAGFGLKPVSFCNIGNGVAYTLSSNGGDSRC